MDREIAEASLTAANYNLETAVRIFLDVSNFAKFIQFFQGGNYQDEQLRNDVLNYGNEANLNGYFMLFCFLNDYLIGRYKILFGLLTIKERVFWT